MNEYLTPRQLADWREYFAAEPFGETEVVRQVAGLAAITANINRKKGARPFRVEQFMPVYKTPKGREQAAAADSGRSAIFAFASMYRSDKDGPLPEWVN